MADRAGRLPEYLIVGAQKSGTTSLASYVGGHPDAFCTAREVHYFDRFHDRGLDWYRSCFHAGSEAAAVGEPTPEYLYQPEVPPRIAELVPAARLLVILRQPADRAYSHYWHNRTRAHETLEFAEALAAEPDRMASAGSPRERAQFAYVDRGFYDRQLDNLLRWFPREQVHVLFSDDLAADPRATMGSVYRFLGLEPDVPLAVVAPRNRFVEYRSQRLRPVIRRLPGRAQRIAGRLNVRYTAYPPLDAGLRRELTAVFDEDIQKLSARLDRDLSAWRST